MPVHSQFKRIAGQRDILQHNTSDNTSHIQQYSIRGYIMLMHIFISDCVRIRRIWHGISMVWLRRWQIWGVDISFFYIYIYFCCCLFFQCNNGCGTYIWLGLLTWLYFVFFFYYHIIISSVLKWMVDSNLSAPLGTFSWFCMEVLFSIVYRSVH